MVIIFYNFSIQYFPLLYFINLDAFSTSHRSHSSNVGVTKFINICVSGFHLQKEYDYLSKVLLNPSRPFAALIGGAKVSSKITVINNLLDHVDKLLIGGGIFNTICYYMYRIYVLISFII